MRNLLRQLPAWVGGLAFIYGLSTWDIKAMVSGIGLMTMTIAASMANKK